MKSALKTEDLFVMMRVALSLPKIRLEHFHSLCKTVISFEENSIGYFGCCVSPYIRLLRYLYGAQDLVVKLEADDQIYRLYCYITVMS